MTTFVDLLDDSLVVVAAFTLLVFWWVFPISLFQTMFWLKHGRFPYPWE